MEVKEIIIWDNCNPCRGCKYNYVLPNRWCPKQKNRPTSLKCRTRKAESTK